MQWSVTVGFDQRLLPAIGLGNDPIYLQLAEILAVQIRSFSDGITPHNGEFIMIDDSPAIGASPGTSKIERIVNLSRDNCNDKVKYPALYSTWQDRLEYIPRDENGSQYRGYKTGDTDIIVTTLTLL